MDTRHIHSNTPRLVFSGRCEGADLKRWFAILLSVHGNIKVGEVTR